MAPKRKRGLKKTATQSNVKSEKKKIPANDDNDVFEDCGPPKLRSKIKREPKTSASKSRTVVKRYKEVAPKVKSNAKTDDTKKHVDNNFNMPATPVLDKDAKYISNESDDDDIKLDISPKRKLSCDSMDESNDVKRKKISDSIDITDDDDNENYKKETVSYIDLNDSDGEKEEDESTSQSDVAVSNKSNNVSVTNTNLNSDADADTDEKIELELENDIDFEEAIRSIETLEGDILDEKQLDMVESETIVGTTVETSTADGDDVASASDTNNDAFENKDNDKDDEIAQEKANDDKQDIGDGDGDGDEDDDDADDDFIDMEVTEFDDFEEEETVPSNTVTQSKETTKMSIPKWKQAAIEKEKSISPPQPKNRFESLTVSISTNSNAPNKVVQAVKSPVKEDRLKPPPALLKPPQDRLKPPPAMVKSQQVTLKLQKTTKSMQTVVKPAAAASSAPTQSKILPQTSSQTSSQTSAQTDSVKESVVPEIPIDNKPIFKIPRRPSQNTKSNETNVSNVRDPRIIRIPSHVDGNVPKSQSETLNNGETLKKLKSTNNLNSQRSSIKNRIGNRLDVNEPNGFVIGNRPMKNEATNILNATAQKSSSIPNVGRNVKPEPPVAPAIKIIQQLHPSQNDLPAFVRDGIERKKLPELELPTFAKATYISERIFLRIFNQTCNLYIHNACHHPTDCQHNHQLPDHEIFRTTINKMNVDRIIDLYDEFICRSQLLFDYYFCDFCDFFGKHSMIDKLKQMVNDCAVRKSTFHFYEVVEGFMKTGKTFSKSLVDVVQAVNSSSMRASREIVKLILSKNNDSIRPFIKVLERISKQENFKFQPDWIHRLMAIQVEKNITELYQIIFNAIDYGKVANNYDESLLTKFMKMYQEYVLKQKKLNEEDDDDGEKKAEEEEEEKEK